MTSRQTLSPSTMNKCRITPNKYSLNQTHARLADSRARDDFSDTGTKKQASNNHSNGYANGIVSIIRPVEIVSPRNSRLIDRSSQ